MLHRHDFRHALCAPALLIALLLASSYVSLASSPCVKTGIEVLREMHFEPLKGKKVGLLTNPTGVDSRLNSTIDILYTAPEVNLVALFAPEHGVRGDVYAGAKVSDSRDRLTGLKVHSLYGGTRKPTQEMLSSIDVLVYDIQDVGSRSYTFISSLGLVMEACAEAGVEVMVLDRPNPLGGEKVEGCIVEDGCYSFISQFPIPYIYGLTVGELARMLNEEGMLRGTKGNAPEASRCRLTVIPMEGWRRSMTFDETGLPWVPTSPQVPQAVTAIFYPVTGFIGELSGYVNTGIGYTLPFQLFAAEWITDAGLFARRMNALALDGVEFRPIHYRPFSGSMKDKTIQGVQIHITGYKEARLTEIGFYLLQTAADMYPDHPSMGVAERKYRMFDYCMGSPGIRRMFAVRHCFEDIKEYWRKDESSFRQSSAKYYLYE